MKLLQKSLMAAAMTIACASSFAQSSSAGIDATGEGVIQINGIAVGSCSATTVNVDLGTIDFHVIKNAATGAYEHPVTLPVTCTNPNQHWSLEPAATVAFDFASSANGNSPDKGYVSLTSMSGVPGGEWEDELDLPGTSASVLAGVGTSSVNAKLIFGKSSDETSEQFIPTLDGQGNLQFDGEGNVIGSNQMVTQFNDELNPVGTIDGRGAFSADIIVKIRY